MIAGPRNKRSKTREKAKVIAMKVEQSIWKSAEGKPARGRLYRDINRNREIYVQVSYLSRSISLLTRRRSKLWGCLREGYANRLGQPGIEKRWNNAPILFFSTRLLCKSWNFYPFLGLCFYVSNMSVKVRIAHLVLFEFSHIFMMIFPPGSKFKLMRVLAYERLIIV